MRIDDNGDNDTRKINVVEDNGVSTAQIIVLDAQVLQVSQFE